MLSALYKYSGSFAKVRAMKGKLLKNEDYDALLIKNSVNDVALYLKNNTHYKSELEDISERNIHRGELESILQDAREKEFSRLFKFEKGNNKKFLSVFILRYEIEILKEMLRMLENDVLITFSHKTNEYYKKHMSIDIDKLIHSQSILQFIDNLKGSSFYDLLSPFNTNQEHLNIFSIEMTLDVYYFNNAWLFLEKFLQKKDKELVKESFGTELDILNIMWILRSKKYFNTPKEIIYAFILPRKHKLKHEQIVDFVEAKDADEVLRLVKETPYRSVFEKDDIYMEQYYYRYVNELQRKMSRNMPFSIMSIISYIHSKDIEVNNITKIIEGIRYKLDMNEIERYLIRNGGDRDGS